MLAASDQYRPGTGMYRRVYREVPSASSNYTKQVLCAFEIFEKLDGLHDGPNDNESRCRAYTTNKIK